MERFLRPAVCLAIGVISGGLGIAQTDLVPHEGNPIITYGPAGSWDEGLAFLPDVVQYDGTWYLFYTGSPNIQTDPLAIGLATSADGFAFTKSDSNPVLEADGTGYDALSLGQPVVIVEGGTWVLYYNARSAPGPGPGPAIGRATAPDPTGPWTQSEQSVLETGGSGEWDSGFVTPNAVCPTEGGYTMYYSGGVGYPMLPSMVGMATSPDGVTWVKYDDPATSEHPYAESDPVVPLGDSGEWDSGYAWMAAVLETAAGWEMYYTGDPDTWTGEWIGYATSTDGVTWTKWPGNPILGPSEPWATLDVVAGSAVRVGSRYVLYYSGNTTMFDGQIGVAATPITGSRDEGDSHVREREFSLCQNYPNPFRRSTTVQFSLASAANVRLRVVDQMGREITTLAGGEYQPGLHRALLQANGLGIGTYFCRLEAGALTETIRLVSLP